MMSGPHKFRATVDFEAYVNEQFPAEELLSRVRRCIETHPTLSFTAENVTVVRLAQLGTEAEIQPQSEKIEVTRYRESLQGIRGLVLLGGYFDSEILSIIEHALEGAATEEEWEVTVCPSCGARIV